MSPYAIYEQLKQQWVFAHPDATHDEYMFAMIELAGKAGI